LARTLEREFVQADAHHALVVGGRGPVVREESDLAGRVGVRRVGVERLAPGGALGVIDLAQVEHLALHDTAIVETPVFDHTPVSVLFAVFLPQLRPQKHIGWRSYPGGGGVEEGRSSLQALSRMKTGLSLGNPQPAPPKIAHTTVESAKSG
jgi:hypothetical protein